MSETPRNLLRQQLAKFVPDPRTLRALEQALAITEQIAPDVFNEISVAAASAEATAVQALGQIAEATQSISIQASTAESRATQALQQLVGIAQEAAITAGSADDKAQTALSLLKDIQQSVAFLEQAPALVPERRKRYGVFHDTTTQTAAAINTAYAMTFDSTDLTNGVYIGVTTSQVYVDTEGVYNIQFSAQLDNTSGGSHLAYIWYRINGSDVANSASQVRLKGTDGELVAAWNFVTNLKAGDYIEIMWSVSDTNVQITATAAAAPVPAIPSVILTVTDNIS